MASRGSIPIGGAARRARGSALAGSSTFAFAAAYARTSPGGLPQPRSLAQAGAPRSTRCIPMANSAAFGPAGPQCGRQPAASPQPGRDPIRAPGRYASPGHRTVPRSASRGARAGICPPGQLCDTRRLPGGAQANPHRPGHHRPGQQPRPSHSTRPASQPRHSSRLPPNRRRWRSSLRWYRARRRAR